MAGIEGDRPTAPQELYKQECVRGVSLFQKSLQNYQQSQIHAQKKQYKDVMDKALQIIHETATQCLSQEMQRQELKLAQDYKQYMAHPSPETLKTLEKDLQNFQKEI